MKTRINLYHNSVISFLLIFSFLLFPLFISSVSADENIILKIMEDEMNRSTKDLKLLDLGPPYFVSYQIKDDYNIEIGADFGAVYRDSTQRFRNLFIETRIGNYELDNTDSSGSRMFNRYSHVRIPLDDNEDALRRTIWLATDSQYKTAALESLRKKGKLIQRMDLDKLSDFSKGKKNIYIEKIDKKFELDRFEWREKIREASGYFKKFEDIIKSHVELTAKKSIRYYINSEGSKVIDQKILINLVMTAWTQAEDGMWLNDSESFHALTVENLPSQKEIKEKVEKLANTLISLKNSSLIDPYIGPAIFEPDAAGVLFHEAVGHRLEGERQRSNKEGSTFKNKIGLSVMPDIIDIYDDPTLEFYENTPLFGFYKYDAEGQEGKNIHLIDKGVLKNFIMSRTPVKGFNEGNGHGRSDGFKDPVGRMSSLVVKSNKEVTVNKLKEMLIAEAKKQGREYGLIISKVVGGETNTSRYKFQAFKGSPTLIYKVYVKDGRVELVRGAEFVGTPLSSINRIIAAGDNYEVFNGYCGAESGFVPSSTVSPSILLSEIELQRKVNKNARLPILQAPPVKNK